MASVTVNMTADTSNDGYSDTSCDVRVQLVDGSSSRVELRLTERTDRLYFDVDELRDALTALTTFAVPRSE